MPQPEAEGKWSVGMLRHVLNRDRVRRIEDGNGDEPNKADWMEERTTLWPRPACNSRTVE